MFPFYTPKINVLEAIRTTFKAAEAALPMNTSHDALRGHLRSALMSAHGVSNTYDSMGPWISDVFPSHVVYSHGGQTYKRSYTSAPGAAGNDPTITVGQPKRVHVAYVSSASESESMRISTESPEDMVEDTEWYKGLQKKESVIITVNDDGHTIVRESVSFCPPTADEIKVAEASGKAKTTVPICIIKPGWGSCAYYSKEMIQKTGPAAFPKNTQMFLNHQTDAEEAARPENDVNNLASVTTRAAYWDENGPKGPGLYSEALVFPDHADTVLEKGPYIGCSINAAIKASEGSAEGRNGLIAEAFTRGYSVDYVTKAGAGGAPIVPVTESARGSAPATALKESTTMTEQEIQALRDQLAASNARIVAFESQQNRILAVATVGTMIREAGLTVKTTLLERVCESPKMTDGKVDLNWARAVADDLVGVAESNGRVEGLGEQHVTTRTVRTTEAEESKSFSKSLGELGISEAGMKYALGEF